MNPICTRDWKIGERIEVARNSFGQPQWWEEVLVVAEPTTGRDGHFYVGVLRDGRGTTPFWVRNDHSRPIPPKPETASGEVMGTVKVDKTLEGPALTFATIKGHHEGHVVPPGTYKLIKVEP